MTDLRRRAIAEERMDAPDLPPDVYRAVLGDLARVNRMTLAYRPTIGFIARAMRGRKRLRLLDVGFGQGDMLRAIARWTQRNGIKADLVGVDLNPGSEPVARDATAPDLPVRYRTGDYRDEAGGAYDIIVSSLVAHHMTEAELIAFLRFMEREAARGWIVNDLHRRWFPHAVFPLLASIMRWHGIVREDGRLSVARSFRADDWRTLLDAAAISRDAAHIVRRFPYRLCVERMR